MMYLLIIISTIVYFASIIIEPHQFINSISIILVGIISVFIFNNKKFGWIFFPYIFGILGGIIPCYFSEIFESYFIESQQYAYLTGATARASSLCSIFLMVAFLTTNRLDNLFKRNIIQFSEIKKFEIIFFKIILIISTSYLLFSLFKSGPPLFNNLPRFNYFHDEALPAYRFFYTLIPFLSMLLSLSYLQEFISKIYLYIWMLILICIPFLTNEKFSLYMDIFFYFTVPLICNGLLKTNKKFILSFLSFFALMIGFVVTKYVLSGQEAGYIFTRISLQGEMVYGLDLISSHIEYFNPNLFFDSFLGFSDDPTNFGMYHLMRQLVSGEYVNSLAEYNQVFTMPFPSNFSYFFTREFAPIVIALFGAMIGFSILLFYKTLISGGLFNAFLAATLYHYLMMSAMMGRTERLLHPITIFCLFVLGALLTVTTLKGNSGVND